MKKQKAVKIVISEPEIRRRFVVDTPDIITSDCLHIYFEGTKSQRKKK